MAGGVSVLRGTCTYPGGPVPALALGDKQSPCALDMAFYCRRTAGGAVGSGGVKGTRLQIQVLCSLRAVGPSRAPSVLRQHRLSSTMLQVHHSDLSQ